MKNSFIISIFLLLVSVGMVAQEQHPAALGGAPEYLGYTQVYDFIDELADMRIISVSSVVKPYDRNQIAAWLMEAAAADSLLSVRQRKELWFYLNDFALECDGMYDGLVQWSNAGKVVNRELWGDAFLLKSTVNSQQSTDISHGILSPTDDTDLKDFLPSGFNDSLSCFARFNFVEIASARQLKKTSLPSLIRNFRSTDSTDSLLPTPCSLFLIPCSLLPKFSLSLLQPAFHYADKNFECKINPILGMDLTMNGHGMVMHRWYGAEIRADIVDHVAVWGSIRDHSYSGEHLDEAYFKSVGQSKRQGALLSQPGFLNNLPGGGYHWATYGADDAEIRAGIKAYSWWGSIGLVKENLQWGDSYYSSNIISNRALSFPMIELKLKPVSWFRLDYIHGFLASMVADSTKYYLEYDAETDSDKKIYRQANKYLAANMLTFTPVKGVDLSVGSAVIYGTSNMFAVFSLPISFFNSTDFQLASGGKFENENSQIFLNVSTRNLKYTHFYASVFVDEFNVGRLKKSNPEHNLISWKVGGRVSNWPVRDLSLTAEFTRTNILTYKQSYPTHTWASNGYNLGHYLGDNAQEVYVALAYKPVRGLSLTLSYVGATKYNDYDYVRKYVFDIIAQKPFDEKVWRSDEVKLHAVYEVVNNAYAFVDLGVSSVRGFDVTSEPAIDEVRLDAAGYLKRYTPAFYWGENVTLKMGFSFYY